MNTQKAISPVMCCKTVTDENGSRGELWVVWYHASPPPDAPWHGSRARALYLARERFHRDDLTALDPEL